MIKRKTAGSLTQHLDITVDGDHVNIKTTTTLTKQENDFKLGTKYTTPAFGLADGDYEVTSNRNIARKCQMKLLANSTFEQKSFNVCVLTYVRSIKVREYFTFRLSHHLRRES